MLTYLKKDLPNLIICQILLLQGSQVIPTKIRHLSRSANLSIFAEEKNHCLSADSDVELKLISMGKVVGIFAGEIRGSVGKVTFRKANGENVVSQKVTQVANPRSEEQQVQRMKMYTVIKAYSLMKNICDHSFEGATGRNGNMSRFMKLNLPKLRTSMNASEVSINNAFLQMGQQTVIAPNDYQISEGSLECNVVATPLPVEIEGFSNEVQVVALKEGTAYTRTKLEDITVKELHELFGCEIGTQITICTIWGYTDPIFAVSRYVFNVDNSESKVFEAVGDNFKVSNSVLDMNKTKLTNGAQIGIFKDTSTEGGNKQYLYLGVASDTGEEGVAAAIILSRKENATWKRSTSNLVWTSAPDYTDFVAKNAIKTWKVGVKNYLNNAAI